MVQWATFESGWKLQNVFHWVKSISYQERGSGGWVSRGQFTPINSARFVNDMQEHVFHLTPWGSSPLDRLAVGVPYQDKSNVERWAGKADKRCAGNVWFIPYETIQSKEKQRPHPATFPLELAERCLKIAGCAEGHVLDPFLGSGTTGVAARRCRAARFTGIDMSPTYAAAAFERINAPLQEP
jgi:site-specific DNA-methyltransferase (adenine-specific)